MRKLWSQKSGKTRWALLAAMIFAISAFIFILSNRENPSVPYKLRGDESPLLAFVVRHMMDESGGIYTNLRNDQKLLADTANNHQILSESVGLMMHYAILSGNHELFKAQHHFLTTYLMTEEQFIRWVHDPYSRRTPVHTNATIDDLKIIHALYEAADRWNEPKYETLANRLAEMLKDRVLADGWLPDYYDWELDRAADHVTSSYLDLASLHHLARRDPDWRTAYLQAETLLKQAALPNGLFLKTYRIEERVWMEQDEFNMIDVLYAAMHLQEAGHNVDPTALFLINKWTEDNKIYAAYDRHGQVVLDALSPAVYALAYRLLIRSGSPDLAEQIYSEMNKLSVQNEDSPYYGGFVELSTLDAYSFDQLQAMLAEVEKEVYEWNQRSLLEGRKE